MTSSDIAKYIDHSVLHPSFTDEDLKKQCAIATSYNVAAVCVKPYHVQLASALLKGTDVKTCSVISFPHGNSTINIKVLETKQACIDGATEIDMVVNIGKVLQEDWDYVTKEIKEVHEECIRNSSILKVIFENDFLLKEKYKIKLCEICSRLDVEFVKTSTGFGFVKDPDGKYTYKGATAEDLKLMLLHTSPSVQVKAAGGIRTLNQLLEAVECGASRVGASATVEILKEAVNRFGE